jgi:uncharacterized oligopeptide transporter (OPT) family protein
MDIKPRGFIHHESSSHLFGNLVIGKFALPMIIPAVASFAWFIIAAVSGYVFDLVTADGKAAEGFTFMVTNFLIVGVGWGIVGAVVGLRAVWRLIREENDWSNR